MKTIYEGGKNEVTTQPQAPDLGAIKDRQQKIWSSGDFARIGSKIVVVSEFLCESVDLRAGDRVLDVATGAGNTAISAARRYGATTGLDYVPDLIEQAKRRAEVEGLEITFEVGDAEDLPYGDASFDVVLSTFGVMFAPDQEKTASELLRVCKPGGKIGLANWTPDGFIGQLLKAVGRYVPPPPGLKSPPLWGTEERLRDLFGEGISSLEATRRTFTWRYPSAKAFVEDFREYYGPTLKAFEALEPEGQDVALARDFEDLIGEWNTSGDETAVVPSYYLEAVARRR